jgi:hypothetical protein
MSRKYFDRLTNMCGKGKRRTERLAALRKQGRCSLAKDSASPTALNTSNHLDDTINQRFREHEIIDFISKCTLLQAPLDDNFDFDLALELTNTPMNDSNNAAAHVENEIDPSMTSFINQTFEFPMTKDVDLEIPCMKTMRLGMEMAKLLAIDQVLYDPTHSHVLQPGSFFELPECMKPTPAQFSILHHPLMDIFPWPSVRTRLIYHFALPIHLRPPIARDPMSILSLFTDTDDIHEGLRMSDGNGFEVDSWEGKILYRIDLWHTRLI